MAERDRSITSSSKEKGSSRVDGGDSSNRHKRPSSGGSQDDTKRSKIAFGMPLKPSSAMGKIIAAKPTGIQIKLGASKQPDNKSGNKVLKAASIFNDDDDDDDEEEEMPPEARMRMRNIGRETPTSAGPNSFGKTKQGFCDSKKVFEKTMKKAMDNKQKEKE